jgi:hypothetical protein
MYNGRITAMALAVGVVDNDVVLLVVVDVVVEL